MLEVIDAVVRFDGVAALDGCSLGVEQGSLTAVMGPSGSGKSTLLRVVAGLQDLDEGDVRWQGTSLVGVPPYRRRFGLMFQDHALFPHRDVAGNVAFGLEMLGLRPNEVRRRVDEALELVGLAGYGDRDVQTLSGGEAQRVALARTLAPRPRLVMLDEPLGSLDRALRDRLIVDMRRIFDTVGSTVLYVTHDQEEAFAIADAVAVLRRGQVQRVDTPEGLWADPRSEFVAEFLGFPDIVDAKVIDGTVDLGFATVPAPPHARTGRVRVALRPGALRVVDAGPLQATVRLEVFKAGAHHLEVELPDGRVLHAVADRRHEPGAHVAIAIDPDEIAVLTEG